MRIENSSIVMDAAHSLRKTNAAKESLRVWVNAPHIYKTDDRVTLSPKPTTSSQGLESETEDPKAGADLEASLKKLIVEILAGHKIKLADLSDLNDVSASLEYADIVQTATQRAGSGLQYNAQDMYLEQETISFEANGVIKTKDGQAIAFHLRLDMTREFVMQRQINIQAGDAALMDPLVINYGGEAAALTNTQFAFDIDSDGVDEELSHLTPGRGFLVFDKNNDGIINNGQELFGPSSGDGFNELAAYDSDGNQWIDEADEIYSWLSVLTVTDGQANVQSLSSHGIGAIYLGNLAAPFDLRSGDNELMGRISRTGLFLREDGTPGTVQHLDIKV